MKTINVEAPIYEPKSGASLIKITDNTGGTAVINIDFETLLPFANKASKEVLDFFIISSTVYGIDRFVERKANSLDGWSRELNVSLPVHDPLKWNPCKDELNKVLSFLTGDYWDVSFRKENFNFPKANLAKEFLTPFSQVNLFSGGLDSLIGALDFLKSKPKEKVLFVSHYDSQMKGPKGDQKNLINELEKKYPNQFLYIPSIRVFLKKTNRNRETTFRSRSILFIGIALLAAEATNTKKIIVPENGTVSLNFPLSTSRRSSLSTRTTHPHVLETILSIWHKLSISKTVQNPYEFKTKGQMVNSCLDAANLSKLVIMSNSCGKRGHRTHWQIPDASHCGVCMPCAYRQASLATKVDKTTYGNSINSLTPFLSKKSQDVGACLNFLKEHITKEEIKQELIVNGIKNQTKLNFYVNVVWDTRKELTKWVKKVGNSTIKTKAGL
tara:strand:- start:7840 stop:9162 length:1323 start_codon:yes stop_codon:yes gene_type:complete